MEDMLAANPKIDAVFCENDSMCLEPRRPSQMLVVRGNVPVGVDGETAALEAS